MNVGAPTPCFLDGSVDVQVLSTPTAVVIGKRPTNGFPVATVKLGPASAIANASGIIGYRWP